MTKPGHVNKKARTVCSARSALRPVFPALTADFRSEEARRQSGPRTVGDICRVNPKIVGRSVERRLGSGRESRFHRRRTFLERERGHRGVRTRGRAQGGCVRSVSDVRASSTERRMSSPDWMKRLLKTDCGWYDHRRDDSEGAGKP